jgi:hypothetical protein
MTSDALSVLVPVSAVHCGRLFYGLRLCAGFASPLTLHRLIPFARMIRPPTIRLLRRRRLGAIALQAPADLDWRMRYNHAACFPTMFCV